MFSKLKLDRPLAVFDIEATGLSPRADRIVELSVIRIEPNGRESTCTWLLNPCVPIPLEATAIHGITDEDVRDCPTFLDVVDEARVLRVELPVELVHRHGQVVVLAELPLDHVERRARVGLGAVGGIVLWIMMLRPWGVRKCVTIMCVAFAAAASAMCAVGQFTPVAVVVFLLTGVGFAGGMYLVPIMNGDVIDYDELKTGARREGIYAGVNSLITKPAISLANAAFLMIAKWFGYNTELQAGMQSATAKHGILVAWMAIPALMLIISAIGMKFYPLHGKGWDEMKASLARRHEH